MIVTRSPSGVKIDVFDTGWAQRAAEGVVLDFRFPVRRNVRVSVGLNNVKGNEIQKGWTWDTTSTPPNTHITSRNCESPFCCAPQAQSPTADTNGRDGRLFGTCSSIKPLQEYVVYCMRVVPSLDSSTLTIHSCYREFTFNPCNVDLGLVEFVFAPPPHFVEFNFDSERWKPAWQTTPTKQPPPAPSTSPPSLNTTCTATTSRASSAKASSASSQPQ